MINYKRLTEIDQEISRLKRTLDLAGEGTWSIEYDQFTVVATIKDSAEANKAFGRKHQIHITRRVFVNMVHAELASLQAEKRQLLNKKWWQFWI